MKIQSRGVPSSPSLERVFSKFEETQNFFFNIRPFLMFEETEFGNGEFARFYAALRVRLSIFDREFNFC